MFKSIELVGKIMNEEKPFFLYNKEKNEYLKFPNKKVFD